MRDSKNFLFPPALTIVFLAHCAGLFATPAQAQVITLVRNTGQLTHSHARCNVGINSGEKYSYAQGFTTGDNEDGYTLSQVVAVVSAFSDISPRISIYTGTGGKPDSNLYTLNNPGTFSTGDVTFTAPPNATLEKETKYFVVLEQTSTSGYYTLTGTGANNEDSGGVSGWSIADGRLTRIGSGQWAAISPFEIKIKIKGIVAGNNSPVFSTTSATLNFQETEGGATTRTAGNVGAAVVATDADNDTITYTLKKGTDADKFRIVRTTGRIRTKAGERYDYEAKESYSVTAKAKDGNGGTATIDLTIDITDQDEPPLQMQAPTVENPSGIHTALDIRGTAPENTGRPPITGYLYRWRRAGTASWTSRNSLTSPFRAVGLTSGREYELQVQAINDEGDGVWSPSATAHTTAPATGEPAISGTARVKQTLTADISNISDANGLANVVWIYRWRREDSDGSNSEDISGATSSAYVLAAADEGKKVRVGVSFTDDAGFDEVLTSDAYPSSGTILEALPPNTPATGAPTISGTPQEGEELTAAKGTIADDDGMPAALNYQWVRLDGENEADITGETSSTYTMSPADVGKKVKVKASFEDDRDNNEGPLTSDAYPSSGAIVATTPTNSAPTFDESTPTRDLAETVGNATVGTATNIGSAVSASDSDAGDTLTYTLSGPDTSKFDIGSTSGQLKTKVRESYDYETKGSYSVTVTVNDGTVNVSTDVTINITDQDEPPLQMQAPSVSSASETSLRVSWTAPDNAGRPSIGGYAVQYRESGTTGWTGAGGNITGTSTMIGSLEEDAEYEAQVQATNAEGTGPWSGIGSGATGNNPATGEPTISGTAQVGETLTAATSGISDVNGLTTVSYSYQWIRVDSDGTSNAADIGTDDDEYTLVSTDEGKKIKVEVTFDDDDGNAEGPLTNNAYPSSGTIRAADTVVPPDTTRTGTIADAPQSLQAAPGDAQATLTWEAPLNDGGSEITGYAYRYKENGGIFGAWTDIPESATGEANETGYTVEGLTNGLEYTFEVRVENPNGGGIPARATVRLPVVVSTESEELPTELTLWDNYPNPFNPETVIDYVLPQTSHVRLAVYDMTGKTVAVLMDGIQPQGRHTARFNADGLPTGTYVYQLIAGAERLMRTMTLVR